MPKKTIAKTQSLSKPPQKPVVESNAEEKVPGRKTKGPRLRTLTRSNTTVGRVARAIPKETLKNEYLRRTLFVLNHGEMELNRVRTETFRELGVICADFGGDVKKRLGGVEANVGGRMCAVMDKTGFTIAFQVVGKFQVEVTRMVDGCLDRIGLMRKPSSRKVHTLAKKAA
jgi:hypothetical protein